MKKPQIKDAGAEYAEIWGEAIHTNRHLRVISVGLAIGVLLLIVVVIRIVSVEPPRPIVVRVDEVGRAEAVTYKAMEAQADPLDPTTKYFLNRLQRTRVVLHEPAYYMLGLRESSAYPESGKVPGNAWQNCPTAMILSWRAPLFL